MPALILGNLRRGLLNYLNQSSLVVKVVDIRGNDLVANSRKCFWDRSDYSSLWALPAIARLTVVQQTEHPLANKNI